MTLENAVRQWVSTHDLECESCGKALTDSDITSWMDFESVVDVVLQCGWCWEKSYTEFELHMA